MVWFGAINTSVSVSGFESPTNHYFSVNRARITKIVYRADEDLPEAVEGKEVAKKVEVLSLPSLGPLDTFPHVLHVMDLHE